MKKLSKYFLITILALLCVLSLVACGSLDDEGDEGIQENGLTYILINNETAYEISKGTPNENGEVIIPASFNGKPVIGIGYEAFRDCTSLISVTIPNSVTSIGYLTFHGCASLTEITIPNSVTSIEYGVFDHCTGLASITVASNNQYYKSIDGNLYNINGTTLIKYAEGKANTSVTFPDGVTSIGNLAFYNCTNLISVTIPDGVTSIEDDAFRNCTNLTSITIPDSVTSIGDDAFRFCDSLARMTLPFVGASRTATDESSVFGYIFGYERSNTVQASEAKGTIQQYYDFSSRCYYYIPASLREIVITDVTSIPYGAFIIVQCLQALQFPMA